MRSVASGDDPPGVPERPANPRPCGRLTAFLANFRAAIIVLSGEGEGVEYVLDQARVLVGRGPGVDLALDDPTLERVHAAIEFDGEGYHLRERTGETEFGAGTELKDEARFVLGEVTFGYVLETRRGLP
jgi:pSer/pThr/pTyr-binding forkhead associated (FHA) protein